MPSRVLKSVRPLVPPSMVSLRRKMSHIASARAWVMMEKYTPLMRLRKAKNPKTSGEQHGYGQGQDQGDGKMPEGLPEQRQFLDLVPDHEVRQGASVYAGRSGLEEHVHADAIPAQAEEHGLAQGHDAGIAPDEIDAQGRQGEAEIAPEQVELEIGDHAEGVEHGYHHHGDAGEDQGRAFPAREAVPRRHQVSSFLPFAGNSPEGLLWRKKMTRPSSTTLA